MKKASYLAISKFVLRRLIDEHCFGGKQMTLETISKFIPPEFERNKHMVKSVVLKMIAKDWLKTKSKHYGLHVWINPDKLDEIRTFVLSED
ncbi:MAG: hypothetical protein V1834_01775 [Candidatus Micrarchaeota archaeon]